jgi:hypothetical protein
LKPKDIPGLKKEEGVSSKRMSPDEFQNKLDEMHRDMDLTLDEDDAELDESIENYEGGNITSRMANVSITARLSLNKEEVNTTLEDFFFIRKGPDFRNMTELVRYKEI